MWRHLAAASLAGAMSVDLPILATDDQQTQGRFGATAVGIVVDATVRDTSGKPVPCLEASQFEVFEDGVPQRISSFEAVDMPGCGTAQATTPSAPSPLLTRAISTPPLVTALVFEELGPEARIAAWRAATIFVEEGRRPGEFVGVFVLERALHSMAAYTRDKASLLTALRRAAMRPGCPIEVQAEIASAAFPSECRGGLSAQGRANDTLRGLQAVVRTLTALPGRKNIVLFSEGFAVPTETNAIDLFQHLTSGANQATITFHAVDAAGLRLASGSAETRRKLRGYTGGIDETGNIKDKENTSDLLAGDPTAYLERLASDTGGQYVSHTNDLDGAVRRLTVDMRDYYRLTYSPTNDTQDGRYRSIKVNVSVPGVVVRSRTGYLAGPGRATPVVVPHELAPHLLLDADDLPKDFPFSCEASVNPPDVTIAATVTGDALTFTVDPSSGRFEGGLTVLARVRGKDQRVLAATSETFSLSGPREQLAAAQGRALRFSKQLASAGAETLEVVAYDVLGRRASAQRFKVKALPKR
jgi:VWFA-related protein